MVEAILLILAISLSSALPRPPATNTEPVIGILSLYNEPLFDIPGSHIEASYVKFIESGGARVVPLLISESFLALEVLFWQLNGIFFTGGDNDWWTTDNSSAPPHLTDYGQKACYLYNLVKQANDKGIYMPLWGTCQGIEIIHICEKNDRRTVTPHKGYPKYHSRLRRAEDSSHAYIFNNFDPYLGQKTLQYLTSESISFFAHNFAVGTLAYSMEELRRAFIVVLTSDDLDGEEIVALIEGKKYPIFASMFHPERPRFEWSAENVPHGLPAVYTSTYFSLFFVNEARRNQNTFSNLTELKTLLIYNYSPLYIGDRFETVYFF